jgi:NAD-dependent dihydropyrimidine dehydrogenase PreA subunit
MSEASVPKNEKKPDRGWVEIDQEECKGCALCVEACSPHVLELAAHLNRFGYHPAVYLGSGCNGCGLCFYACPEPGAIRVYRRAAAKAAGPAVAAEPAQAAV